MYIYIYIYNIIYNKLYITNASNLLGRHFKVQTDHQAYTVIYVKVKENRAADCLSPLFSMHDPGIERKYDEPDLFTKSLDKIDSDKKSLGAAMTNQEGSDIDTEQLQSSSTEEST